MVFRNKYLCIFLLHLFIYSSCLYSRTFTPTFPEPEIKKIKINFGNAILKINGRVNENLYLDIPDKRPRNEVVE